MTSYTGRGNKNALRRILQVALTTSYTGTITTRLSKNTSSGIDDELHRGNNKTFRRILQVALMTSYTGAITRLSEESFKWH